MKGFWGCHQRDIQSFIEMIVGSNSNGENVIKVDDPSPGEVHELNMANMDDDVITVWSDVTEDSEDE
jgi:hypothetical protein